MSAEPVALADCQAGLALSPIPVWVLDIDAIQVCWANEAALELWKAQDPKELLQRQVSSGMSEAVRHRFRHAVSQVRAGNILFEEWVFFPRGKPTTVLLHLRAVILADGRIGMLNQALPIGNEMPPSLLRAIATLRHASVIVVLADAQGGILTQNPAAMAAFGDTASWISWLADPEQAKRILQAALAGETVTTEALVRARDRERWHAIEANTLRDPVSGELAVLLQHKDETARVEAEQTATARGQHIDELSATLALVEAQRREILTLSAPILDVGASTLAIPIIGRLDEDRSTEILSRLLAAIVEQGARRTILDLTGVVSVDGPSVGRLRAMVEAIRLVGATPVITGIRPDVAQMLAESGIDLAGVSVMRSLADGLRLRSPHSPGK